MMESPAAVPPAGSNDGNMSTDEDGRGTPTPPSNPTERSGASPAEGTMLPPSSPVCREQLTKRIESLSQQNRVLKCELETYKLRVKSLQEENRHTEKRLLGLEMGLMAGYFLSPLGFTGSMY